MELEEARSARLYLTNGRVPRPSRKNPRNIPFEAEQLLYRFTSGSQNPPRGQSDSFLSPSQHWDCLNTPCTDLSSRQSRNSSTVKSRTIENLTTPNSHSTTRQWSTQSPSLATPTPPRPASKPIARVDNSPSLPPRRPSSSSSTTSARASAKPSANSSTKSRNKSNLSPSSIPRPSVETPRRATRDELRKTATVGNANHHRASTSRLEKPSDRFPTTQRRARRIHEQESSSEYESSRTSSKSPEPGPHDSPPRRSGRARKDPVTYNVRALVGLELEQTQHTGSVSEGGTHSGRSSPQPADAPLITSVPVAPQTPQITGSGSSRVRPNVERLLRNRQQGRFQSNAYYNRAYADSLSELRPWRTWKGASNDVICLAWSPDGSRFAAGATSHGGDYNRGNNLVFGDLTRNSLRELPDHWEPRPKEHTLSTQDNWLFTTISATHWVADNLYTASFDKTVKIWDVGQGTLHPKETLQHNAPVEVMAVSKNLPNKLATGTKEGFRLWHLGSMVSYENLDIVRYSGQKNVDLSPTNLIWGNTPETKNLLVGGMVQRTDDVEDLHVARYGHLSMWKVDESAVSTIKLSPDSQNIFDIKWHPSMPIFATASSMRDPKSYPLGSESLVNLYTYLPSSSKAIHSHSFPCPAVDINETTFCPIGSNHVTASCTDGSTYVWDTRFPNTILHKLQHGNPLLPISPDVRREYADVGVRVALWGSSIDQFYTGGSDGCIKQWDIRRATEDALVADVANLNDAVMSAAFSPDKAHLLVGDNGCGIHVLSSGPSGDPEPAPFDFEYAPTTPIVPHIHQGRGQVQDKPEPAGVAAARELLETCQLTMDPLYGPVQGPQYAGPYARWSRNVDSNASDEEVSQTPFLEECQLRQFEGPALRDRNGLDENSKQELQQVFNLAHACNGRRGSQSTGFSIFKETAPLFASTGIPQCLSKRKRGLSRISISGDEDTPPLKKNKGPIPNTNQDEPTTSLKNSEVIVISDDEDHHPSGPARLAQVNSPLVPSTTAYTMESPEQSSQDSLDLDFDAESTETLEDLLEDDHWWPDSRHVDANISRRRTDG